MSGFKSFKTAENSSFFPKKLWKLIIKVLKFLKSGLGSRAVTPAMWPVRLFRFLCLCLFSGVEVFGGLKFCWSGHEEKFRDSNGLERSREVFESKRLDLKFGIPQEQHSQDMFFNAL